MINRIETEYDPATHQVKVSYGTQIQELFQSASGKITEVIDERTFADLCDELGDSGPRQLASGAILLSRLARAKSVSADANEWNWALTLVAWSILKLADSSCSMGDLPIALTALAYIAPVELPEITLPAASEVLDAYAISHEARTAYEEIRTIENVQLGAIPTVASAGRLWMELRGVHSLDPAFLELKMRLESNSLLFRSALKALARINAAKNSN